VCWPLSGTKIVVFTRVLAICCKLKHFARCLCSIFKRAMCFHIFFAFFHKKQHCRSKLDDSVTQKKPGGRRRTEFFTHIGAFTQKSFIQRKDFTQKPLLKGTFAHKRPGAFRHRNFYTKKSLHRRFFYTQICLYPEIFTQRSLYTEELFRTKTLLHSKFLYTQGLLHREIFTQRSFLHTGVFIQRSLYSKELLHKKRLGAFTHKIC